MKIVVLEPGKAAAVAEIDGNLQSMQKVVGGYIQIVPAEWLSDGVCLAGKSLELVLNEEGKLFSLPYNHPLHGGADYIAGTFFVTKSDGENLVSLNDDEADAVLNFFKERR